jgi:hypothetical protein
MSVPNERLQTDDLREALQWALREGAKGFYTVEHGADTWYYCKFCHAVASVPGKLRHEDQCKLFHVKKLAVSQ